MKTSLQSYLTTLMLAKIAGWYGVRPWYVPWVSNSFRGLKMINPRQLRDLVVYPVLDILALHKTQDQREAAAQLLLGTAMQESECGTYIAQLTGPALGVWQMEPATASDVFNWSDKYNPELLNPFVMLWKDKEGTLETIRPLSGNLYLACALARMLYFRRPEALPAKDDIDGQARYYKQWYNTPLGAATVAQYKQNWTRLAALL
jgi:hypothetical protein